MSPKGSDKSKRSRRPKKPIEPIHVEELLAGAGMSGFLGVLDPPAPSGFDRRVTVLEQPRLTSLDMKARVASVVLKMEALGELINAVKNRHGQK